MVDITTDTTSSASALLLAFAERLRGEADAVDASEAARADALDRATIADIVAMAEGADLTPWQRRRLAEIVAGGAETPVAPETSLAARAWRDGDWKRHPWHQQLRSVAERDPRYEEYRNAVAAREKEREQKREQAEQKQQKEMAERERREERQEFLRQRLLQLLAPDVPADAPIASHDILRHVRRRIRKATGYERIPGTAHDGERVERISVAAWRALRELLTDMRAVVAEIAAEIDVVESSVDVECYELRRKVDPDAYEAERYWTVDLCVWIGELDVMITEVKLAKKA